MTTLNILAGPSREAKYYTRIKIFKFEKQETFEPGKEKPKAVIYLPLPLNLSDTTEISIEEQSYGAILGSLTNSPNSEIGALENVSRTAADIATLNAGSLGTQVFSNLTRLLGPKGRALSKIIESAASTAIKAGGGQSLGQGLDMIIQQNLGAIPNPNKINSFRDVRPRSFELTFDLLPFAEKEAETIYKIIRILKHYSLPAFRYQNNTGIFNFPHIAQVNFFPWDKGGDADNKFGWTADSIVRTKRAYIQSVGVSYSEARVGTYHTGQKNRPTRAEIRMRFAEIEYFTAQDWGLGIDGPEEDNSLLATTSFQAIRNIFTKATE